MKKLLLITALILSLCACKTMEKGVEKIEEEAVEIKREIFGPKVFIFSQKAATTSYVGKSITLNRVFHTTYFDDEKMENGKQISTKEFFETWKEGAKTATLNYQNKDRTNASAKLELTNPKLGKRNSVIYKVKIISGKLPKISSSATLNVESDKGI